MPRWTASAGGLNSRERVVNSAPLGGRVPQINYNGNVSATKASCRVGRHRSWSNLERERPRQVKTAKTRHTMSTPRNHSQRPTTDGGDWWTSQDVGAPTTPSEVKGETIRRIRRLCIVLVILHAQYFPFPLRQINKIQFVIQYSFFRLSISCFANRKSRKFVRITINIINWKIDNL